MRAVGACVLVEIRRRPSERVVEELDGWLELGHSYRANVYWDTGHGLMLSEALDVPAHHFGAIHWVNLDAFPELRAEGSKTVAFEHVRVDISHIAEWEWLSVYHLKLIEIR